MLETDCIIPQHVPIPHDPVTLYGNARAVRSLMDAGFGKWAILKKLRISEEAYKEAVYEINKSKAVDEIIREEEMARGKKLDTETVSRIRKMKNAGCAIREIAEECGCGISTVNHICSGSSEKKSQINEAFDAAVNEMIAESRPMPLFNSEFEAAITEPQIPQAVIDAVRQQLDSEELLVEDNLSAIRSFQQENEEARTKIAALKKWLQEVSV